MSKSGTCANGCDKPIHARGLCGNCYKLAWKRKEPLPARHEKKRRKAAPRPDRTPKHLPATRVCKKCHEEQPLDQEHFRPDRGNFGWECRRCYNDRIRDYRKRHPRKLPAGTKACPECGIERSCEEFGETRWLKGQACLICKPKRREVDMGTLVYEFAFARDVLELDRDRALGWVAQGYKLGEPESVARQLDRHGEVPQWEPDPLLEDAA